MVVLHKAPRLLHLRLAVLVAKFIPLYRRHMASTPRYTTIGVPRIYAAWRLSETLDSDEDTIGGEEMTLTLFYRSGLCANLNVNRL